MNHTRNMSGMCVWFWIESKAGKNVSQPETQVVKGVSLSPTVKPLRTEFQSCEVCVWKNGTHQSHPHKEKPHREVEKRQRRRTHTVLGDQERKETTQQQKHASGGQEKDKTRWTGLFFRGFRGCTLFWPRKQRTSSDAWELSVAFLSCFWRRNQGNDTFSKPLYDCTDTN